MKEKTGKKKAPYKREPLIKGAAQAIAICYFANTF